MNSECRLWAAMSKDSAIFSVGEQKHLFSSSYQTKMVMLARQQLTTSLPALLISFPGS
jgi:hypothetical protein